MKGNLKVIDVTRTRRWITRFCPRCQRYTYAELRRGKNRWLWHCTVCGRLLRHPSSIIPTWELVEGIPTYRQAVGSALIKLLKKRKGELKMLTKHKQEKKLRREKNIRREQNEQQRAHGRKAVSVKPKPKSKKEGEQ